MTGSARSEAAILAAQHVAAFNDAVASGSYVGFLRSFTDDAVVRFENVPGAGRLEFAGREAYTQAYAQQPPDDQIDISGPVSLDGATVAVPIAWRRDQAPGTMWLTFTDGVPDQLDEFQVTGMTVEFG
jgi:steroid Delta-isomerase